MALFWARKHEFCGMIKVTILSQIHASWHFNVSNSWVSIYSLNQGNVKLVSDAIGLMRDQELMTEKN